MHFASGLAWYIVHKELLHNVRIYIVLPTIENYIAIPFAEDYIVVPSTKDCFMIHTFASSLLLNVLPCKFTLFTLQTLLKDLPYTLYFKLCLMNRSWRFYSSRKDLHCTSYYRRLHRDFLLQKITLRFFLHKMVLQILICFIYVASWYIS